MACSLIWSPISRDDLHDIVRFIARDNGATGTSDMEGKIVGVATSEPGRQASSIHAGLSRLHTS